MRLDLNGQNPTVSSLATSGTGSTNLIGSSGSSSTLNFAGSTSTFAGIIRDGMPAGGTGQLSLTVQSGVLALTGTSTYTGQTTINSPTATLQIGAGGNSGMLNPASAISINSGSLVFDRTDSPNFGNSITGGGALQQIGSGTLVLSGNLSYGGSTTISSGAIEVAGVNNDSLSGPIAGPGNLIVGDGVNATNLNLQIANGYSGSTTVNAGSTLNLQSPATIANTSGVTLNGGTMIFTATTSSSNFGPNAITIGPGAAVLQYGANALLNGLSNDMNISASNSVTVDIHDSNGTTKDTYLNTGALSGGGALTITNTGGDAVDTYTLQGASPTFTGGLTIGSASAGAILRLEVNSPTAIGTGPVTIFPNTNNQLWFNTTNTTYSNNITLNGVGTTVDNPSYGAMRLNNGLDLTGTITLSGDSTVSAGTSGSNAVTFNGQITGPHILTLMSGVFTINNTTANPNNYGPGGVGAVATILTKYTRLATQEATVILGSANALSSNGGVELSGGVIELNGFSPTFANLTSGSGSTNNTISNIGPNVTSGTATITIGDGSGGTFGGTIADGAAGGTLALTFTNAVNQTLTGRRHLLRPDQSDQWLHIANRRRQFHPRQPRQHQH